MHILPRLINILVNHNSDDSYLRVRAATIVSIGAMGTAAQNVTPILIQALKDDREEIRANAAVALGRIGQPVDMVVPALLLSKEGVEQCAPQSSEGKLRCPYKSASRPNAEGYPIATACTWTYLQTSTPCLGIAFPPATFL